MQFSAVQVTPPLTSAQGALVAVSLGQGVVGLFESKLPFKETDKYPLHTISRPLLIIGMLLVGGWQYVRTRLAKPPVLESSMDFMLLLLSNCNWMHCPHMEPVCDASKSL